MTPISRYRQRLALVCLTAALTHSARPAHSQPTFTDEAESVLPGVNLISRSASLADIDDDGDLDLFFQGGTGARQLFRNNLIGGGSLSYSNISATLPDGLGPSWSAAWGDYDGDGRVDVFVGQSNINASGDVLKNEGASGFVNASAATGLDDPGFHQNVAWSDIDNDRDLDLLIAMEGPEEHQIYLHGPGHSFLGVGANVGFQAPVGTRGYGMAIGDTDGDGDKDVYISTCREDNNIRNNFYQNMLVETGTLGFEDIADENGAQFFPNSYGAEFQDFDDDGDLDLLMVGADREPSKIFRNDGGNMFTDVDEITGHPLLSDTAGDLNGARAIDYDNDGDLDLYFHDHRPAVGHDHARKLYRNDGDWEFTDVTAAEGLESTNEGSHDSPWGDIDNDGDLDLIGTTDGFYPERVFLSSASENGGHWLYVRLEGPTENTTAIGATLHATIDQGTPEERTLRRDANANAGTFNQSDLPVHFGLGAAETIDELRIEWPDGLVQRLYDVAGDQYFSLARPGGLPGDYNDDGVVDASDYAAWRDNLGAPEGALANDVDGGPIGAAQYATWKDNFGSTLAAQGSGASAGAPEPGALLLALAACGLAGLSPRLVGGRS